MHAFLQHRHRKDRENRTKFASLIESPAAGEFVMPANGRIRFVATAGATAGDTAATLVGTADRTIKTPDLDIGGYVVIDRIERAVTVTPSDGFNVELDIGLGRWSKIAEGAALEGGNQLMAENGSGLLTEGGDGITLEA